MTALLLTDKDAAAMLSIGVSTLWQRVKEGLLPAPVKIGSKVTRWKREDLERFVSELKTSQ